MSQETIDMFEFITTSYKAYGDQVNKNRMITLSIDGLKPVERRVLVSAFTIAKNKKVKSVQVDGHCLGHYHPHAMCYGTIVQMVKQGFLDGQGQFGANIGTEPTGPAASRYTECGMSEFTKALAFELIDYVPWVESEVSADIKEPLYLPTKYPFCLIGKTPTGGIGFGYAANIPCYEIKDLNKRLMWLLKERKREPVIAPITDCEIVQTSDSNRLKTLLTEGKETLIYKGRYDIDRVKKQIICKSLPPRTSFNAVYSKLQKKYKDLAILDSSCDELGTYVIFYLDRVRNQQQLFEELISDFDSMIIKNVSFENNQIEYHDSDDLNNMHLTCMSIDKMLLDAFNNYQKLYDKMLSKQIAIRNNKIVFLDILSKIKKVLPKYLNDIKKMPDVVIKDIATEIKIEENIVKKTFNDYTIIKLLKVETDTLKLKEEIALIEKTKKNLFRHIIEEYSKLCQ
jgi:DNA gyrase/topoisomerase IV subunit A